MSFEKPDEIYAIKHAITFFICSWFRFTFSKSNADGLTDVQIAKFSNSNGSIASKTQFYFEQPTGALSNPNFQKILFPSS